MMIRFGWVKVIQDASTVIRTFDEAVGSGFRIDGSEGAGVGVWRLVDVIESSAARL